MSYYSSNIENISVQELKTQPQILQTNVASRLSANNAMNSQISNTMPSFAGLRTTVNPHVTSVLSVRQTSSARNQSFAVQETNQQMQPVQIKTTEVQKEQERKIRREIANSNERRRMQSINAGYKSLKAILPHGDDEKLSKAAILQQTSEYILQLETDKWKLMQSNEKLRRAFSDCKCNSSKHRALIMEISDKDEGIGSPMEEDFEDIRRNMLEVRKQLEKERRLRITLEEKVRILEATHAGMSDKQHETITHKIENKGTSQAHPTVEHQSSTKSAAVRVIAAPIKQTCTAQVPQVTIKNSESVIVSLPPVKPEKSLRFKPELNPIMSPPPCTNFVDVADSPAVPLQASNIIMQSKSTQPLKKRPVEVLHQDSNSQPQIKVPKMTVVYPNVSTCPVSYMNIINSVNTVSNTSISCAVPQSINPIIPPSEVSGKTARQNMNIRTAQPTNVIVVSAAQWRPRSPVAVSAAEIVQSGFKVLPHTTVAHGTTIPASGSSVPIFKPHQAPIIIPQVPSELPAATSVIRGDKEITLNQLNTIGFAVPITCQQIVNNIILPPEAITTRQPILVGPTTQVETITFPRVIDTVDKQSVKNKVTKEPKDAESKALQSQKPESIKQDVIEESPEKISIEAAPEKEVEVETSEPCASSGGSSPESTSSLEASHPRRNLDAIVQAIDHIEQQERRNSQDSSSEHTVSD